MEVVREREGESREGEEGRDRAIYGFKDLHTSRIGDREENGDREEECRQRRSFSHAGSNNLETADREEESLHYGCIPASTTGMETEEKTRRKKLKVLVSSADMSHLNICIKLKICIKMNICIKM